MAGGAGRPPRPDTGQQGLQVAGHSTHVQEKIDEISMLLLDEFEKQIRDRIEKGGLSKTDLTELMSEFRKNVKATARPATSITMIRTGPTVVSGPTSKRKLVMEKVTSNPERRTLLREKQRMYVEKRQQKGQE